MKYIPNRIWLQTGGQELEGDCLDFINAVTWCQDKQEDGDTEYIKDEEIQKILADFLDKIREYEHESGKSLAQDERDSSEFVEIYLQKLEAVKASQ